MKKILVTICNYNHSKYLKQSIESIQNQTHDNLDICVIDDGSEDLNSVKEIMESFKDDSRIRFLVNEKNMGKWWCLNKAISTTTALVCTSHDADDVSLKQRIQLQSQIMLEQNNISKLISHSHSVHARLLLSF